MYLMAACNIMEVYPTSTRESTEGRILDQIVSYVQGCLEGNNSRSSFTACKSKLR